MSEHVSYDKEATEQVSMWVCNDGDFYFAARDMATDPAALGEYLTEVLNSAREPAAAHYTRRMLSDYDMERVDWAEVASDLLGD